jgi:general secretion pathway protein C
VARKFIKTLNLNKKMTLSRESFLLRFSTVRWDILSSRLAPWLNGVLVVVLAYALAGISWRLWPQAAASNGTHLLAISPTSSTDTIQPGAGLAAVAVLHLFGEPAAVQAASTPSVIEAPETRLSLTLKGIVSGSAGIALIAEGSANEEVYRVGDALPGGAMLHEVLTDKVILQRGGRFETLTLPRERAALADAPPSASGNKASDNPRAPSLRGSGGAVSEQLRTLRDVVVNDPQQAFALVQAQPVMEGGVMKGYRVNPGKERKLFLGSGLRAGDVVTSINGIALSDTAQLASLFSQFKSSDRFNLVVERGGQQTNLTIDLGK